MVPQVLRLCLLRALACSGALLLSSGPIFAQASATPTPAACYPACRDGFTCSQGQCVSLCNPPCPSGLECVEGRRCEPPLPRAARPYEPPPPRAKAFEELSHTLLGFHWGMPGSLKVDDTTGDAASTFGFNLRADAPVAKYVLLGPLLQFGSWRPERTPPASHSYYLDLDLLLRFRVPITTASLNYQVWVGMPLGISANLLADQDDAELGIGWNIGVLFGGAVHFTPKFGLFAEVGYAQHRFQHSRDLDPDIDLALRQPLLNVGIVVRN
jgi:hypothetical protein